MKKQKFMKLTAHTAEPDLANSFAFPATHNAEISIVFGGKDISVHGYDGSVWTTLHTWDGESDQFTADNLVHQYTNFYLKSLTGSDETIRVSFFSAEKYQGSTPSLAGINRDVKLYDVDEVPIYTASDDGKFLTIRSDGSLAWLAANESFIVAPEGGDEGGGNPPPQANFLEELDRFNFTNGIINDNGSGQGHRTRFNLDTDNIIAYGGDGQPVEEEFTISWWMYINSSQDAGNISLFGRYDPPADRFACSLGGNLSSNIHFPTYIGTQVMFNSNTGIGVADQWVHVAYTCKSNGSNLILSLYVNGNKLNRTKSFPLGSKLLPSTASAEISIGGSGMSGKSAKGQFDSIQIEDGIALTDAQVAAIAAQTDRQMGIEAASLL
tara:strand:- start:292 stop:1434 length:1143 start_codon:yes stop_codon:yes gene_type:complete